MIKMAGGIKSSMGSELPGGLGQEELLGVPKRAVSVCHAHMETGCVTGWDMA